MYLLAAAMAAARARAAIIITHLLAAAMAAARARAAMVLVAITKFIEYLGTFKPISVLL
jgi:hypothetical protein